jgi:endonuclease YncB( thermonuclease family)
MTSAKLRDIGVALAVVGLLVVTGCEDVDGTDLGEAVLRAGWARVYVYDQPFRRLAAYRQAARTARGGDRGIWGSCSGF